MTRIYGVYNADGGLIGELFYLYGKLSGQTHCDLCDITHSTFGEKKSWRAMNSRLQFPVELVHLNQRDLKLSSFTQGITPCVVLERECKYWLLIDSERLKLCRGKVIEFERILVQSLDNFPFCEQTH